jgi:O-antigen ligase
MSARLAGIAGWSLLLLALVLSPLVGLFTPYLALIVILPLFVVTLASPDRWAAWSSYEARALLFVIGAFALLFAITADSVSDALHVFNFTMLLAYGPIALFLERRPERDPVRITALLAALGVLFGTLEVVVEWLVDHEVRPAGLNIGPIVLSNALLALGFVALGGALVVRGRWGWLFVAAPLLAIAATAITASRGPLLSVPVAIVAAALFFWHERFQRSLRAALIGASALVVVLAVGIVGILQGRAGSLLSIVGAVAGGDAVTDESARQRLVLYRAGWQSFLQSPWVGHGWGNLMSSIQPFIPPADAEVVGSLPQLHDDVLNFAVAAGVLGIGLYLVVISAPIIGALLSPRDRLRTFRLYAATVLTIVYAGAGLTDLMFGFEYHTYLFVMLTAIILHYCRDRAAA